MRLHSAGSVVDDVVIPFAYVRVPAPAARSALEDLQRQYSAATPIIVAGKTTACTYCLTSRQRCRRKS